MAEWKPRIDWSYNYEDYLRDGGEMSFSQWGSEGGPYGPTYWVVKSPKDLAGQVTKDGGIVPGVGYVPSTTPTIGSPDYLAWATGQWPTDKYLASLATTAKRAQTLTETGPTPTTKVTAPPFPTEPAPAGYAWNLEKDPITGEPYWAPAWVGFGPSTGARGPVLDYAGAQAKLKELDPNNLGLYILDYDETTGGYRVDLNPSYKPPEKLSPYEQEMLAARSRESAWGQAQWGQQLGFQQQQLAAEQQWQQQQLAAEQQWRAQQLAGEKEARLAQLRAQPASWLEYASLAGQTPAIQPWMLPLMPQQYAGTVAGAPIPGWSAGAPTLAELPELTSPSRQYQARMGPTGTQQYLGYQQARTGAPPSETQWRLWSQAPPSGAFGGLSWKR